MSGAPVIPAALRLYNSYVEDPKWQRKFTAIWGSALALAFLVSLPRLVHAIRTRRAIAGVVGVWEDDSGKPYDPVQREDRQLPPPKRHGAFHALLGTLRSCFFWSLPGVELNLGQMVLLLGYVVVTLVCITVDAPLVTNPNRAGFLALAQLPVVFLFGTKNSLVSLLLGPGLGYEKLNYIHRWSGRCLFIGATVHGALWIRNHLTYGLPILGPQKETSGVGALGALCCVVLFSFRPFRRLCYQAFFVVHVMTFVAFYVTICYHTIYAAPWIYPPLAFYGLDFGLRLLRYRFKKATLIAADPNMTIVHVHGCDGGWLAGQHVRLRVIFGGRLLESHPLTILSAPPGTSCLSQRGMVLGARAVGGWSRSLNAFASAETARLTQAYSKLLDTEGLGADVSVVIDGPYGGCSVDLGQYESVLLVSGGSGATFTLGLLDDIVGRCVKLGRAGGERTRRIEFVWCIKSFGALDWFARQLREITHVTATCPSLDLHISVFVTCLCNPDAVPDIPNLDVVLERPSISNLLTEFVMPPAYEEKTSLEDGILKDTGSRSGLGWVGLGGGVAVCVSGPETLTRETQNAVARLGMRRSGELGGIALHAEVFSL